MTVKDIQKTLNGMAQFRNIYVPEFTYGDYRIDAVIIDISHRWVRGFEIKMNRQDFKSDKKWTQYTSFCSSLTIVCPEGLIMPEEVKKPFGLLWIFKEPKMDRRMQVRTMVWKKRPHNFQDRASLAWLWTYVKVLEEELPRLNLEKYSANPEL